MLGNFLVALCVGICVGACMLMYAFISTESSVLANQLFLIYFNKTLLQTLKWIFMAMRLGFSY